MVAMKNFLLILLTLVSMDVFAELNKWTDANGKVHYSDQPPPPNVKAKILRTAPVTVNLSGASGVNASGVPASGAPGAAKTIAEAEMEFKKAQRAKKEAAEKAAKEQAKAEEIKNVCDRLRQNLMALESGIRTPIFTASGERAYMDDTQRQQAIAKAQQEINTYCK
jgi:hypothetical protein